MTDRRRWWGNLLEVRDRHPLEAPQLCQEPPDLQEGLLHQFRETEHVATVIRAEEALQRWNSHHNLEDFSLEECQS